MKYLLFAFLFVAQNSFSQKIQDVLHLYHDSVTNQYSYLDPKGKIIIPPGKYDICFTEIFSKFAIVYIKKIGLVGINRKENVLFNVYVFDNGPDYPSDGLFRILRNGKIGYADTLGNIIIPPKFDCAFPFENGIAQVGIGCKTKIDGEHSFWIEGKWHKIDKRGNIVD
jgi:hypothetical protein